TPLLWSSSPRATCDCSTLLVTATPFFFSCSAHHRALHSFPTRRSSDLCGQSLQRPQGDVGQIADGRGYQIERWRERSRGHLCLRSEEHTSELQSREKLVCRLLLEKKKQPDTPTYA